jgi:isopenicillin N synthase-like dioxygenase
LFHLNPLIQRLASQPLLQFSQTMVANSPVPNIPVVDFTGWNTESGRQRVAEELVAACKKVGFVYIVNHSLPESMLDEAFSWSSSFFELPQDEKLKAPHPDGWAVHRGYSWPGLEKVSQTMSADNDQDRVKQLREIVDFKVRARCVCLWSLITLQCTPRDCTYS